MQLYVPFLNIALQCHRPISTFALENLSDMKLKDRNFLKQGNVVVGS